jgi:SAM-dependent methyltransferase
MMIHEVPDARKLLTEIHSCLKSGGRFLVAEPRIHVPGWAFAATVATANEVGFQETDQPWVRWCRAVVFEKA